MYQQTTVWNEKNVEVAHDQWEEDSEGLSRRINALKLSRTGLSILTKYPTLLLRDKTDPLTTFEMPKDPDEKCEIPAGDWCALRFSGGKGNVGIQLKNGMYRTCCTSGPRGAEPGRHQEQSTGCPGAPGCTGAAEPSSLYRMFHPQ